MLADRRTLLEDQLAKTNERLTNLAAVRAGYANEVAETKNRAALLERAEQNLAEARATRASAKAASLISRIDTPDAGIRPVGPSRAAIALCGVLGGLLAGFGVVFLTVPAGAPCRPPRRRSRTVTAALCPAATARRNRPSEPTAISRSIAPCTSWRAEQRGRSTLLNSREPTAPGTCVC